ncbi:MAG TPA: hypothetical protein VM677_27970 [Actinokineospora sp.]|jgi:hypothetical protein|nr:hypothetical protein [Actinokineospora sp.]
MPSNPTLPPSLGALFRDTEERLNVLERGEKSLSYRQMLTTNDASNARELHMTKSGSTWVAAEREAYSAALVNPKYPVLVARFHVILWQGSACEVWLRAGMGGSSRITQKWNVTGGTGAAGTYRWHQFEVAWLHGMPTGQWDDTITQSVVKRGNIQFLANITAQSDRFPRNADYGADASAKGFTPQQAEFMAAWFETFSARNAVSFREPEYAFLAPLSAFPTASAEGTLIPGSDVGGYPVTSALAVMGFAAMAEERASPAPSGADPLWPNEIGEWPVRRRTDD